MMNRRKAAFIILAIFGVIALCAATVVGYLDIQVRGTPGNPSSGYGRIYLNSGGLVKCIQSSGTACLFDSSSGGAHAIGMAWGQVGGASLSTGASSVTIPFACTIQGTWYAYADSGTVTFGVTKNGSSIVSGGAPSVTGGTATGSTSGWTTSVSSGDLMGFSIASTSTATAASIVLGCN